MAKFKLILQTRKQNYLNNSFFCSNCKSNFDLSDSGLSEFKCLTSEHLQTFEFTVEETYNILLSLDVNMSVGPDAISNRILRDMLTAVVSLFPISLIIP